MRDKKEIVLAIFGAIILSSIVIVADNYEQIKLIYYGDIEDGQVRPIMDCGKLLETVLPDKPWVLSYTLGYANSTNKFYLQYVFVYPWIPHKAQHTKWQEAPRDLVVYQWGDIEAFAGSWLPDKAYNWQGYPLYPKGFSVYNDNGIYKVYDKLYEDPPYWVENWIPNDEPVYNSTNAAEAIQWAIDQCGP